MLQGDTSASQSSMELYYPWISGPSAFPELSQGIGTKHTPPPPPKRIICQSSSPASAEVNFFSVFLRQRCREIWREILVNFSVLRFPGFGSARESFAKISRQKRSEKGEISNKFHSAGAQR